jgi:hypothetical protein
VLEANMGGPRSRSRSERIHATVLGRDDGAIRCPRVIRLGLAFPKKADPVSLMTKLLAKGDYGSPEDLRNAFDIPAETLICRPLPEGAERLRVTTVPRAEVLAQALLLGLCTSQFYDPGRPVLWTQASLTRGLELFDPAGFYA